MSENKLFDYPTVSYIYNDESHYLFSNPFDENSENQFSCLISNIEMESQIPSSDKRTNFDDNFEKSNLLKLDEDINKNISNDLNISQENNFLQMNAQEEIIINNENNNLPELDHVDNRITQNFQIFPENNNIQMEEEEEEIIDNTDNNNTQKNTEKKKNTRFTPENLLRKVKHILLGCILRFLNEKIRKLYHNQIGKGIAIKQFKTLNQKEKSEPNIQYNKDFLHKTIGEILSEKISKRMTNYTPFHNKNLVQHLLNEEDMFIRNIFEKLFSLTFFDYLNHFKGKKYYNILQEMPCINKELQKYSDQPEYVKYLYNYLQNYDIIINKKKSRKSKKNKGNKKSF